jgi:hypothetical protein
MDNPLEDALGQSPEGADPHVETAVERLGETPEPETPAPETPEPPPAAETPPAPEPGHVPLSAVLDEREKRQAAEKALRELQERLAAQQPAAPAPPEAQVQAALYQQNLRNSRRFAEREYGKDLIATVHDWAVERCDADPHFNAAMRSSDDPYEAAVQAYNRDQLAAKVTPDRFAAFEAWEKAQAALQAQPAAQTPQPAAPTPPRSLAEAPGSGLRGGPATEIGDGVAFGAAIT